MELPIKAKMKLQGLIDAEQSAQDQVLTVTRRISSLSRALATAPASEAASTEDEIARLRGKLSSAQLKHRYLADQIARLRHFLDTIGSAQHLEDAATKPARVEKGETLAHAATRIRARIAALKTEQQKVMTAGLPAADAKKMAAAHVAKLVEKGRPRIRFGHDGDFRLIFDAMVDGAYTAQQDFGAALAYLDPAAFLQRLCDDIDAMPKPALTLSVKARAEKLGLLEVELLTLEFEDEAIVEASEVEGPVVLRRPDADPRAVLAVTRMPGKPAPARPAAKLDRIKAADPLPIDPIRKLSERELIKHYGANRLPGVAGE